MHGEVKLQLHRHLFSLRNTDYFFCDPILQTWQNWLQDTTQRWFLLQTTKQICLCLHTLQFYGNMLLDTTTIIIFDFGVKLTRKTTLPSHDANKLS